MIGSARAQVAATLVFVASVLLVITQAPTWSVLIALGCAVWRLLVAVGRIEASRPTKVRGLVFSGITVLMVLAVLISFRTLNGLAAGTALLVVMGALKVLESRSRRDDAIVIGVRCSCCWRRRCPTSRSRAFRSIYSRPGARARP
jgi:hypothetical protein